MLANVLNSERAAQTSVQVVRVFVRLRQMPASNAELARKLEALEAVSGSLRSERGLQSLREKSLFPETIRETF